MAFEDRFSPSTATSPNSGDGNQNPPDSPESSRTFPYTCPIIPHAHTKSPSRCSSPEKSFFRITSYALSKPSPTPSTHSESPSSPSSSVGAAPSPSTTLKYSIFNILQPDFGKNAVHRTKPTKISFKPYERSVSSPLSSPGSTTSSSVALGSLCQTVSQIGKSEAPPVFAEPLETSVSRTPVSLTSPVDGTSPDKPEEEKGEDSKVPTLWPAWVYCTRYSDRPSSGPRSRRIKKTGTKPPTTEEKRPRTAFSGAQLARLKNEFTENRYLTERRRQQLSSELGLNEAQIKIWFQNKRAKIKKSSGQKNPLALQLMAQGLYNHSTVACDEDDMPLMSPLPQSPMH